ncbi:hypothetical protein BG55_11475 [Erwinia mallotivora]|uniref:PH domain-containing protein n=1 Tax=Erwinia mallotivora TaxID=69222 RepID=A0A014PWS4_9GAMM|nr:hypothetical protein BG55_11475 [Erwinia mallotivora]
MPFEKQMALFFNFTFVIFLRRGPATSFAAFLLNAQGAEMQVDWFRVITDLERAGFTHQRIARHLIAAKSTVMYSKNGSEPRYSDGERLIRLWELVTEKTQDDLPFTRWEVGRYRRR